MFPTREELEERLAAAAAMPSGADVGKADQRRKTAARKWNEDNASTLITMDTPGSNTAWRALAGIIMTPQHAEYFAVHEPSLLQQAQEALLLKGGSPTNAPKGTTELLDFLASIGATLAFSGSFGTNYLNVTVEWQGFEGRVRPGWSLDGRAENFTDITSGYEAALVDLAGKMSERTLGFNETEWTVPKLTHTLGYKGKR